MSLLVHMIESGRFQHKKILAIDETPKSENDRTWCFWEKDAGLFEPLVFKRWDQLWFRTENMARLLHILPYQYKMIRAIDYYTHCMQIIRAAPNVEVRYGKVSQIQNEEKGASLKLGEQTCIAQFIFSSIPDKTIDYTADHFMLQHFLGWVVRSNENVFDPHSATLMDFDIPQKNGTCFFYLMPFDQRNALIEYTVFSNQILEKDQYEEELTSYLKNRFPNTLFTINHKEKGIIPMTSHRYKTRNRNIIFIGAAGGRTKPSSGYTFRFIQEQSVDIVEQLIRTGQYQPVKGKSKFRFYDRILLNVLLKEKATGKDVFSSFFKNRKAADILEFLDEKSNLLQDLKVIAGLPFGPFVRAGMEELKTLW